jgi:hypothetical protein
MRWKSLATSARRIKVLPARTPTKGGGGTFLASNVRIRLGWKERLSFPLINTTEPISNVYLSMFVGLT